MSGPQPISLPACIADFEVAQRKESLALVWFYEYGHRLLQELEDAREDRKTLRLLTGLRDVIVTTIDDRAHITLHGNRTFSGDTINQAVREAFDDRYRNAALEYLCQP
jgi:hypothetical protein